MMAAPAITFCLLRFTIVARDLLVLPEYKGATFRGGFGAAFKKVTCIQRRKPCPECLLRQKCLYLSVFESQRFETTVARHTSHDPHPFVLEPPLDTRTVFQPGENLTFNLVLIGRGIDYLPYFVIAFQELGDMGLGVRNSRFELLRVDNLAASGVAEPIFDAGTAALSGNLKPITYTDVAREVPSANPSRIVVDFATPMRLKLNGKLAREIDFALLVRSVLRRLSWLAELHCGRKWDVDYPSLVKQAAENVRTVSSKLQFLDLKRYSTRQEVTLGMGGLVGTVSFEGELAPFLPCLKLGEYLHVGNNTAFGLGKYRIEAANA